eukprot:3913120-Rhodomonas_salina.1
MVLLAEQYRDSPLGAGRGPWCHKVSATNEPVLDQVCPRLLRTRCALLGTDLGYGPRHTLCTVRY